MMTGSTSHPVSRSSTTEAKLSGIRPVVAGQAADPQHVAADRGGQHVGHELAGQVVRQQPAEAGLLAHGRQHRLPAHGRQHDAGQGEAASAPASQQRRCEVVHSGRSGLPRVADLGEEEPEHHAADREPEGEHEPALEPARPGSSPASSSNASCTGSSSSDRLVVGWIRLLSPAPSPGYPTTGPLGSARYRSRVSALRVGRGTAR